MNTRYQFIVFNKAKTGYSIQTVIESLAKELNISPEKLAQSLAKKPLVLKQNLTKKEALRYKQFAEKIGIFYKIIADSSTHQNSVIEAEDMAASTNADKMSCPKCGTVQDKAEQCSNCGVYIRLVAA